MSILRGDFAPDQVAAIEDAMERTGLPFASAVRMLVDYGVNARHGYRIATESLPEGNSKRGGEGETPESQDPVVMETEREGSGENGESVSVPDSPEQVRAKAKALRTRTRTQPMPIPDPPPEIDSPGLRAFLPEFAEYRRKQLKKPLSSENMWNLLFNQLKPAGREHAVLALRYSISNGWRSFDIEWLKGKPWEQVASELGLSLSKEAARIDPEAEAALDRKRARELALRDYEAGARQLVFYDGSTDNWLTSSSCWLYDGLDALQEPTEFEARLTHARALIERLRALGAFPLVKAPAGTATGLIFPACGGGPWRPMLLGNGGARAWTIGMPPLAPSLPTIDDPVSPNPPSDAQVFETHNRLTRYLRGERDNPADFGVVLIGGDPVSREAIERNYGQTVDQPGAELSTETDAEGNCEHGTPYRYPCEHCEEIEPDEPAYDPDDASEPVPWRDM